MGDLSLASRSAEILKECLYANIATSRDDVPWNTPVTALPDSDLNFYWSSWTLAEHSRNIARNSSIFMTFYDSTRARGTNNLMCLYLQCVAREVSNSGEVARLSKYFIRAKMSILKTSSRRVLNESIALSRGRHG